MFLNNSSIIFIIMILYGNILFGKGNNYNVVLIAVDALQAQRISSLGYANKTTPNIDIFASQGVSFAQAISPSSWTIPTYLSILSSTFPSEHSLTNRYREFDNKVKIVANFSKDTPDLQVLPEILNKSGYRTAAFTGSSGLSAELGYNKGFETFYEESPFGGIEKSANKALLWLKEIKKDQKFFLLLHGYDAHGQFELPQNYKGKFTVESKKFKGTAEEELKLREAKVEGVSSNVNYADKKFWSGWYDSKIFDADQRLSNFLTEFEKLPFANRSVVIILSDHGTEIFEHGAIDHGHTLYDELIRVPFIWKGPGIKRNLIVKEQVSTIDLLPTLLDYLNIQPNKELKKQIKGRSLKNALFGKKIRSQAVFSETDYRNLTHKRSIRSDDFWKLIITLDDGSEELYNLKNDPNEESNLSRTNNKKSKELFKILDAHLDSMKSLKK